MGIFTKKNEVKKQGEEKTVAKAPAKKTVKKDSMKDLYTGTKSVAKKTTADKKGKKDKEAGSAYRVLVKPLITEKAADLASQDKYVFEVEKSTNKIEVAKAINEVYGVEPVAVNIVTMKGKLKRQGRYFGKRKDWKKAIITLPKGKTINIYEGV